MLKNKLLILIYCKACNVTLKKKPSRYNLMLNLDLNIMFRSNNYIIFIFYYI